MTDTHQVEKEEVEAKAPLNMDDIANGEDLMTYLRALTPRYGSPHMHERCRRSSGGRYWQGMTCLLTCLPWSAQ